MSRVPDIAPGKPVPLGATRVAAGVNFAIFSRHAKSVTLVLFAPISRAITAEIPLRPERHRTGDIWHVLLPGLLTDQLYGFKADGPYDPQGSGHCFDGQRVLLDPYARALAGNETWGRPDGTGFERLCCIVDGSFDWEGDRPLNIPMAETIIYELHVRGFTRHPSAQVDHPGTFAGVVEKIPYLQQLGITTVELLPITDFNENENINRDPLTGAQLMNFWGYSPISFFAPKASFAANTPGNTPVREFKEMVKQLHRANIEVILDVVFNHTAEGGANGPLVSYRGLDNTIYYLLDQFSRDYLNFSGCGNTMNCNHPVVRNLIIDALHYWVMEMHVDGFRFDLASVLGRDRQGRVMSDPPMVEKIAEDPILAQTKIIAEAWDAAGAYQVGSFSRSPRWAEWNGRYRDDVRYFMCGLDHSVPALATRIAGSSDLYQRTSLRPANSINFITSHDGFTLHDLVSYSTKHNQRNGEDNRDGDDQNNSWNSGVEGPSDDPAIKRLRARRVRTLAAILLLSQGVPMFVAGDEFGRTQQGNNNAYCHDNDISWLDWRLATENQDLLRFFQHLIALRRSHPVFRRTDFFSAPAQAIAAAIRWQSTEPGREDWSSEARTLAFLLNGGVGTDQPDNDFFIMLNGHRQAVAAFTPPLPPGRGAWHLLIDTAAAAPVDCRSEDKALPLLPGVAVSVEAMAAVVLIAKPAASTSMAVE